tara:strand:- start:640 stop:1134 length:495 start_codon:yes stop_codon:yes gene_type:complete
MADEFSPAEEGTQPKEATPPIIVNAQYTKDLSFEAPTAPRIFSAMQQEDPDVKIGVNVDYMEFEDNIFEVVLKVEATCTVGTETAFMLELEYGGLFTVNVEDEVKGAVLLIECPRLLFPFARNILADVSRDGGFPPLMLGPLDFAGMYQQQLAAHNKAEGTGPS